jgi:hypothetical protein
MYAEFLELNGSLYVDELNARVAALEEPRPPRRRRGLARIFATA